MQANKRIFKEFEDLTKNSPVDGVVVTSNNIA
jgi:hypothetical protein